MLMFQGSYIFFWHFAWCLLFLKQRKTNFDMTTAFGHQRIIPYPVGAIILFQTCDSPRYAMVMSMSEVSRVMGHWHAKLHNVLRWLVPRKLATLLLQIHCHGLSNYLWLIHVAYICLGQLLQSWIFMQHNLILQ